MLDLTNFGNINGSCVNYTTTDFNSNFAPGPNNNYNHEKFLVLNFNIRSFNSNIDEFSTFLDEMSTKPHVIILTEVWFSETNKGNLMGYSAFHCFRPNRNSGGVSVFILDSLQIKTTLCSSESSPEIETIHVSLLPNDNNLTSPLDIIAVYRPPEPSLVNDFIDKLDTILNSFNANNMI